ncbi:MAG: hypothetical protein ACXABM_16000 [Candidatus Thorarchaeota archaeon]|jgi:hypothetical protein
MSERGTNQKEWEERYKREQSMKPKAVYVGLIFSSIWAITIIWSILIYSWQGYAELYNEATPESTFFNQATVILLFAFAIIVTIFYIRFKVKS